MKWLSDKTMAHLCRVADLPDLDGTRYELIEKIGQGGMGAVYSVRDRELDRHVALKVVNASFDDSPFMKPMVEEARILARLEHPNIVPVHDCGILPDGRFFYAMKLVRGQRLDSLAQPDVALSERLQLFQKICDAERRALRPEHDDWVRTNQARPRSGHRSEALHVIVEVDAVLAPIVAVGDQIPLPLVERVKRMRYPKTLRWSARIGCI